jgi:hypothetical protein
MGSFFHLEIFDQNNPKQGQVFEIGPKYPFTHPERYGGCCRNSKNYWHKMWDDGHWVYEKNLTGEEWEMKFLKRS